MKKAYLIFLLSSCFSLLFLSIFNHKNKLSVFKENVNNLEKLVDDSIKPNCSYEFNGFSNSTIKNLKELVITIPESRRWSRNLLEAFIDDTRLIKNKDKISRVIKNKYCRSLFCV